MIKKYFKISDLTSIEKGNREDRSISERFKDICIHLGVDNDQLKSKGIYKIGSKAKNSFIKLVVNSWYEKSMKNILSNSDCDISDRKKYVKWMKEIVNETITNNLKKNILFSIEIVNRIELEERRMVVLEEYNGLKKYINSIGPSIKSDKTLRYKEQLNFLEDYNKLIKLMKQKFDFLNEKYEKISEENEFRVTEDSSDIANEISREEELELINNIPQLITPKDVDKKTYDSIKSVMKAKDLSTQEKNEIVNSFYIDYKTEELINNKLKK